MYAILLSHDTSLQLLDWGTYPAGDSRLLHAVAPEPLHLDGALTLWATSDPDNGQANDGALTLARPRTPLHPKRSFYGRALVTGPATGLLGQHADGLSEDQAMELIAQHLFTHPAAIPQRSLLPAQRDQH